jgi:hypothetical protein
MSEDRQARAALVMIFPLICDDIYELPNYKIFAGQKELKTLEITLNLSFFWQPGSYLSLKAKSRRADQDLPQETIPDQDKTQIRFKPSGPYPDRNKRPALVGGDKISEAPPILFRSGVAYFRSGRFVLCAELQLV